MKALALQAGINWTYIGSPEASERNPSLENIAHLALAHEGSTLRSSFVAFRS